MAREWYCYAPAPTRRRDQCGTEDLKRVVSGLGVDLEWVAEHIVFERFNPIDLDAAFEEFIT